MRIYQYVVSAHPDDWLQGSTFDSLDEARQYAESAREYSRRTTCITKLGFKLDRQATQLIDDNREEGTQEPVSGGRRCQHVNGRGTATQATHGST